MSRINRDGIGMTSRRTRDRMLSRLQELGISDIRVLQAMSNVPRHLFVEEGLSTRAYEDTALPIGHKQTISQPYTVAKMTELLIADGVPERVLEIGTGSGYQAAVLDEIGIEVYSVERIESLVRQAKKRLWDLGYRRVRAQAAGPVVGWPEKGPYSAIIVTAGAEAIPPDLYDQLETGGRLVAPVGQGEEQMMMLVVKTDEGLEQQAVESAKFVPLILQ
jgi:protein-L-isoaspartate(D-aspartate) O-methyltransferase